MRPYATTRERVAPPSRTRPEQGRERSSARQLVRPAPFGARGAYAFAYERVLWPTWQRIVNGRAIFDRLSFLEATEWRTPQELEALQVEQLRALLGYAGTHVPYYRELFAKVHFDPRSVRQRKDLEQIPLLSRDTVRERYADLVDPAHQGQNHKKGTSGSTGAPLQFEYSNESESWRQAIRLRGYRWAGYRPGLPTLFYWPEGIVQTGLRHAKTELDRALRRETYEDPLLHDPASLDRVISAVRRMRPNVIVGYTQALVLLARHVEERGARDWDDIPVICGAEAVLPGDREVLGRVFGPEIFETYGSRETMMVASECCAHDGMHIAEENVVVELVDVDGACSPGDAGDVAVTDLHNFGMPLIRYVNGDVAVMDGRGICACGRGLRRLARLEGRRSDTLRDAYGNAIPGMTFHALFVQREDVVRRFQAVQRATGDVELRIVRGTAWSEKTFEPIVGRLRSYLRGLPLSVLYVDEIPPSASGKYRPIVAEHV